MTGEIFQRSLAITVALLCMTNFAVAEQTNDEFAAGAKEYIAGCAACHGEAADGNGPIAPMFKSRVPDLRQIAKRNDGVFPLLDVIHTIDGRAMVKAHGNPMPIFGRRYTVDETERGLGFGTESVVRGRVLELALYLQSIQQ